MVVVAQATRQAGEGEGGRESKIYAGWATLAVVMWSWGSLGRATGGANANKGVSTGPLRPSQTTWYHSTIHVMPAVLQLLVIGKYCCPFPCNVDSLGVSTPVLVERLDMQTMLLEVRLWTRSLLYSVEG
jgi:hypothetical protein